MLTPDLLNAIKPYGIGAFAVVMGYLVLAQILKTYRVRLLARKDEVERID